MARHRSNNYITFIARAFYAAYNRPIYHVRHLEKLKNICYNRDMSDRIVQLQDYNSDNIYPVAGAATQGSITKTMLDEGVFEGPELSDPGNIAYVGTSAIQDNAVTADKIAIPCPVISDILSTPSSVAYVATDNIQDGAVTSDKIDFTTSAITFTPQTSNISLRSDDFKATKFGTQCVLEIRFTTAITFSSNGTFTLGTVSALPSGTAQMGFGYVGAGADQYPLAVFVETNGTVKCRIQSPNASIASPAYGGIRIQYESAS